MIRSSLFDYFAKLSDPRLNRNKKHNLANIIVLSILAVICGAESWDSIEEFGKSRIDFLKKILYLPNGIPSHDTINRVFSMLKPDKFEVVFISWVNSLRDNNIDKEVIAIDGKTIRGSKDSFHKKSAIHIVSAWANSNQLVLGQRKVDGKSNEIRAIPELLEMLDIKGSIVTIDAMGTQRDIAKTIIDNQANYILALKGNQTYLKEDVENLCKQMKPDSENEVVEKGHGRIETRNCKVYNQIHLLEDLEKWSDLKSVIQITAEREINEKKTNETRLYISSLNDEAEAFNKYIRMHWGVENSLHWTLDMTFREDEQRKRDKNSAQNFAIVRKIVLNLLKQEDSKKLSLRTKRLKAGWDNNFLLKILKI
jgi:predicted transposase YbfD/YdcC